MITETHGILEAVTNGVVELLQTSLFYNLKWSHASM